MSVTGRRAPLSKVMSQRKDFVAIDDGGLYKRCRVQLHAKGVVLRDTVRGAEIRTKRQQVCRAGDFLVAEIDAKVGGFGIVPDELNGAIVSSHYFLFEIDPRILDARFLALYSQTRHFMKQVTAQGSTNYAAIRPNDVLSYVMPLPPLDEQIRVVTQLERFSTQLDESAALRRDSIATVAALTLAAMRSLRERLVREVGRVERLGTVLTITSGGTPSRQEPSYWKGDLPWVKSGELQDGDIYDSEEHITEAAIGKSSAKLLPPDTVLVAMYGQGQTRGRTGRLMVSAATNQACCALLPRREILNPRYVQLWLRSLYTELRIESRDGAQPNWNASTIKAIPIAVPTISKQLQAVTEIEELESKVSRLATVQDEALALAVALKLSIQGRAFPSAGAPEGDGDVGTLAGGRSWVEP